jgi:hypothetical protein
LKKTETIDISKFGQDIALTRETIPVFDSRSLGCFIDIPSALKTIDVQRRMYRAKIGIANSIPGVFEAAQLSLAFETMAGNDLHPARAGRVALVTSLRGRLSVCRILTDKMTR